MGRHRAVPPPRFAALRRAGATARLFGAVLFAALR